ncbi:hypothetical protein ACWYXK_26655 [Janthinobacterium lividum]
MQGKRDQASQRGHSAQGCQAARQQAAAYRHASEVFGQIDCRLNEEIEQVFRKTNDHLMRNGRPFDGFVEHMKRVSTYDVSGSYFDATKIHQYPTANPQKVWRVDFHIFIRTSPDRRLIFSRFFFAYGDAWEMVDFLQLLGYLEDSSLHSTGICQR